MLVPVNKWGYPDPSKCCSKHATISETKWGDKTGLAVCARNPADPQPAIADVPAPAGPRPDLGQDKPEKDDPPKDPAPKPTTNNGQQQYEQQDDPEPKEGESQFTATAEAAFRAMDTDGDGDLSVEEVEAGFTKFVVEESNEHPNKRVPTKEELNKIFQEVDEDGDGRLNMAEFVDFMRKLDESIQEEIAETPASQQQVKQQGSQDKL